MSCCAVHAVCQLLLVRHASMSALFFEFPDEPELPEPDEDAALPEVEEELCWFGLTTTK